MKWEKKLAAMIAALTLTAAFSSCGNTIEYKDPTMSKPSNDSSAVDDSSKADDSSEPDDSGDSTGGSSQQGDPPLVDIPSVSSPVVAENDDEYFAKAAFVGEALCSGMGFYVSDIDDKYVYTENNAHVGDILDTKWEIDGKVYGLADALYVNERKYVYIWIGPNDLNNYTPQRFAQKYEELINTLFFSNPMAYVGVVSVAPVSSSYEQKLANGTIEDYNMMLSEMVDKIGNNRVFFFNITATLGDNSGNLLSDYDSGDGLHMNGKAYKAIANYLFDNQIHPYLSDFNLPGEDGSSAADTEGEGNNNEDNDTPADTEEGAGENTDAGENEG